MDKEHRRKLSEALKGRRLSEETKQKMSRTRRGRKLSEAHCRAISEGRFRAHIKGPRGPASAQWRGGIMHKDGYILLLRPEHPNAGKTGYVREHVLVMSTHLGRPIAKNETVHHINGVRNDNRLENLQVMTRAAHASHHHKGLTKPNSLRNLRGMTSERAKLIWATTRVEQRKKSKPCGACGNPFVYVNAPTQKFCSPTCANVGRSESHKALHR